MIAAGGESCADIERLRPQRDLFGEVCSDSTLYCTMRKVDAAVLEDLREAIGCVRRDVWRRSTRTTGTATIYLDIDASLTEIHSEGKEQAAPDYKGGYGYHPMFCFADATGEALSSLLRPGNAGSNTVADHVTVLDQAIAQLPEEIAAGHHIGDDPSLDYRYFGFYSSEDGTPSELDLLMRSHAHVENHIGRLKDSGLTRFPFSNFQANSAWLALVCLSADLVRWFQLLCVPGYWKQARPKALRSGIFYAPGRLVSSARRKVVRILDAWPQAEAILAAYRDIALLT